MPIIHSKQDRRYSDLKLTLNLVKILKVKKMFPKTCQKFVKKIRPKKFVRRIIKTIVKKLIKKFVKKNSLEKIRQKK